MNSTLEINEWTSAIGYKGEEIHIGDWVTINGYKGYHKILSFQPDYADEDDMYPGVKTGELIEIHAKLELVFTSTMKLRLAVTRASIKLLEKVSEEKRKEIEEFWEKHPKEQEKYTKFVVGKELGKEFIEFLWYPDELAYWQEALLRLPQKVNLRQLNGWLRNNTTTCHYLSKERKPKGKRSLYYITLDLIEESVEKGKPPLYHNPRILFGR